VTMKSPREMWISSRLEYDAMFIGK